MTPTISDIAHVVIAVVLVIALFNGWADMKPKCWVDEKTNVIKFRNDVPPDQARELEPIIRQAFNAGLKHGYQQGLERASQTQS